MYSVDIAVSAQEEIAKFRKTGNPPGAVKKIQGFINEVKLTPQKGTGKPEQLRGELSHLWSRRIDKKNRFVYFINEETKVVDVLSVEGHYDDK